MDEPLTLFEDEAPNQTGKPEYNADLYKKWTRGKGIQRFLTIRFWSEAGKVSVDIGESEDGKFKGATQVWTNAIALSTWLKAVRDGQAVRIYPANPKAGVTTSEGYAYYGGGTVKGRVVSRILKVHYWPTGETYDETAFMWKCGHFEAHKSDTGAFIPNMSKPISTHSIKISRAEMAELATVLDLALINHAASTTPTTWVKQITGVRT